MAGGLLPLGQGSSGRSPFGPGRPPGAPNHRRVTRGGRRRVPRSSDWDLTRARHSPIFPS